MKLFKNVGLLILMYLEEYFYRKIMDKMIDLADDVDRIKSLQKEILLRGENRDILYKKLKGDANV